MKLLQVMFVLIIVVILIEISECRLKRKSPDRARLRNERRKERNNRRRSKGKEGHKKQEITTPSLIQTTKESSYLIEELLSMKTKYIEEFSRRRASILGGQNLMDSLPNLKNSNTTNHYTEALLDGFIIPNSVQNGTEVPTGITTSSKLHFKGKFGFHSPHSGIFGRMIHISDVGLEDSHFGCTGEIANEDEINNTNGPWIALVARGKCMFFAKIKLAEKYGASAIVIYDTVPRRVVEVMSTIGTKITSLMINAAAGNHLAQQADQNNNFYVNISVGAIHIEASDIIPKVIEYSYTEALVDFYFDSSRKGVNIPMKHRTTGRYGRYSPRTAFSGRVILINDAGSGNSHFGCSGSFSNEKEIELTSGNWIALMEAGRCNNVVKIKLAERYSASAVVIYDEDFSDEPSVMNTIGTKISALMITRHDGKTVTQFMRHSQSSYLNVTVGATIQGVSSLGHSVYPTVYNILFPLLSFLVCSVSHFTPH